MREPLQRLRRGLKVVAAVSLLAAALPAVAGAAETEGGDSVFWSNAGAGAISHAALDGSGGGDFSFTGTTVNAPAGTAVDAVAGIVYWANSATGTIGWARLNGPGGTLATTGATVQQPRGLAIDPTVARRVYWANAAGGPGGNGSIAWATLSGAGNPGGGDLISGPAVNAPDGVAVDPSTQKIYWANSAGAPGPGPGPGSIMSATVSGTDVTELAPVPVIGATVDSPSGLALDPYTHTLYWANSPEGIHAGTISYWNLNSGMGGDLVTSAPVDEPEGIAIDPVSGELYWANAGNGTISHARLDGTGGGTLSTSGATTSTPVFPVLLVAPAGTDAPQVTGVAAVGSALTCQKASWASDVPAAFYFRAPRNISWQWSLNGTDIPGATTTSYTAAVAGSYTCREMGKNHAGTTAQTSAPLIVSGAPIANTGQASSTAGTSAVLNGTIAPQYAPTGYHFEFGLTNAYGTQAPATDSQIAADGSTHAVAEAITGLQPNRTYHYRLVAANANGTSLGSDGTFATSAGPKVQTGDATSVSADTSLLTGSVNPANLETYYYFQFGATATYGSRAPLENATAGSDSSEHQVTQALTALSASTTYHFRLVAVNAAGTSYGNDMTFTTAAQPTAVLQPALALQGSIGTIGSELRFRLACTGAAGQQCRVSAAVRVVEKLSHDGRRVLSVSASSVGGRSRTVLVAKRSFLLAAGGARELRLHLNTTGRKLRARFGHLPATVVIAATRTGAGTVLRIARVTFGSAPPKLRLAESPKPNGAVLSLALSCSGGDAHACDAAVRLVTYAQVSPDGRTVTGLTRISAPGASEMVLAHSHYSIRRGTVAHLRLHLTHAGRALLAQFAHVPAMLQLQLNYNGYLVTSTSASVTLKGIATTALAKQRGHQGSVASHFALRTSSVKRGAMPAVR